MQKLNSPILWAFLGQAKDSFNRWMFNYPETESNQYMLEYYKIMDEASNFIATHL